MDTICIVVVWLVCYDFNSEVVSSRPYIRNKIFANDQDREICRRDSFDGIAESCWAEKIHIERLALFIIAPFVSIPSLFSTTSPARELVLQLK